MSPLQRQPPPTASTTTTQEPPEPHETQPQQPADRPTWLSVPAKKVDALHWTKRRSVRRQHRRWGRAWSGLRGSRRGSGRISPRTGRCASRTRRSDLSLSIQGRGGLRRELSACLRSGRARAGSPVPAPARRARVRRAARDHDRRAPHRGGRPRGAGALGGGPDPGSRQLGVRPRWSSAPRGSRCCSTCPACPATRRRRASRTARRSPAAAPRRCATRSPPRSRRCPRSCAARSPGTKAPRWPSTPSCGSSTICRSASATNRALGSAAPTRTTGGLLRQYFPKGTDLSLHGPGELEAVAVALNGRLRKTPGWRTPVEALDELLVTAHDAPVETTG